MTMKSSQKRKRDITTEETRLKATCTSVNLLHSTSIGEPNPRGVALQLPGAARSSVTAPSSTVRTPDAVGGDGDRDGGRPSSASLTPLSRQLVSRPLSRWLREFALPLLVLDRMDSETRATTTSRLLIARLYAPPIFEDGGGVGGSTAKAGSTDAGSTESTSALASARARAALLPESDIAPAVENRRLRRLRTSRPRTRDTHPSESNPAVPTPHRRAPGGRGHARAARAQTSMMSCFVAHESGRSRSSSGSAGTKLVVEAAQA